MSDPEIIGFHEALTKAEDAKSRVLLLGNGFSIACRHNIFRYDAVFDRLPEILGAKDFERIQKAFDALATRDFEVVVHSLERLADVGMVYGIPSATVGRLREDAELVNRALIDALAKSHPESTNDISPSEYEACGCFLRQFSSIYTLSYDLLLYWTVLHQQHGATLPDGFGEPEEMGADYVEWELGDEMKADLHYLHGALHLFDAGATIRKVSWRRTGRTLKEQFIEQMEQGTFPLFVAEGDSDSKMRAINHNGYLARAYRSFQQKGGNLFVFGCSFAPSDDHIAKAIEDGKWRSMYVGVYGDPGSRENVHLIQRCQHIAYVRKQRLHRGRRRRADHTAFKVAFFDATSAAVWGEPGGSRNEEA